MKITVINADFANADEKNIDLQKAEENTLINGFEPTRTKFSRCKHIFKTTDSLPNNINCIICIETTEKILH